MKEFKVNDFIKLKLEDGKTNIYVYNHKKNKFEFFNQCKYVLLRKTAYELEDFLENIDTVDELAEHLNHSLEEYEPEEIDISAETRFWVHCSNMQVWAENNYNTQLLHSNLSFPLLKKLSSPEIENSTAKKMFKKEIIDRISGKEKLKIIKYFFFNGYLNDFEKEELEGIFLNQNGKLKKYLKEINSYKDIIDFLLPLLKFMSNKGISVANEILSQKIQEIREKEDLKLLNLLFSKNYINEDDASINLFKSFKIEEIVNSIIDIIDNTYYELNFNYFLKIINFGELGIKILLSLILKNINIELKEYITSIILKEYNLRKEKIRNEIVNFLLNEKYLKKNIHNNELLNLLFDIDVLKDIKPNNKSKILTIIYNMIEKEENKEDRHYFYNRIKDLNN